MKSMISRLFLLSAMLLWVSGTQAQDYFGKYGEDISADGAVEVQTIGEDSAGPIKLEGTIEGTCKMKGCWMKVADGQGGSMMVTFKDYGFFVPKEGVVGKQAIMQGVLEKRTVSVEDQRHYAEDAGESAETIAAITEPKTEWSFIADGVIIK